LNDACIPSEEDFAGPNLAAAASMIRDYAERNSLTPRQLLDTFNAGIAAAKLHMVPTRDHLCIATVADAQISAMCDDQSRSSKAPS
jgi:hypothetical protein